MNYITRLLEGYFNYYTVYKSQHRMYYGCTYVERNRLVITYIEQIAAFMQLFATRTSELQHRYCGKLCTFRLTWLLRSRSEEESESIVEYWNLWLVFSTVESRDRCASMAFDRNVATSVKHPWTLGTSKVQTEHAVHSDLLGLLGTDLQTISTMSIW